MKNCLILARAMLKGADLGQLGSGGLLKSKTKRKLNLSGPGKILLYLLLVAYCFFMFGNLGRQAAAAVEAGATDLGTTILSFISIPLILVFFTSFMYVSNLFYFSNDIETFLVLPVQPWQIVVARIISLYVFEVSLSLLMFVPSAFALGYVLGLGVSYYVAALLIALCLPIIPLAVSAWIVIPLMRFTKWARNRDRFNMISNILFILVIFGGSFLMGFANGIGEGMDSTSGMANIVYKIPGIPFAAWAISEAQQKVDWLMLLVFVIVIALYFAVTILLANMFYLKGAMDNNVIVAKREKLSNQEYAKYEKKLSNFALLLQREHRIVLRTPAFFTNYLLMNLLFPVMMIGIFIVGILKSGIPLAVLRETALGFVRDPENFDNMMRMALLIVPIVGLVFGGMSGLSISSFTREGSHGQILLAYPLRFKDITWVKLTYALLWTIPGWGLLLLPPMIFFNPPWQLTLLVVVLVFLSNIFVTVIGLAIDMFHPKLNWTQEMQAAKQNINVFFEMIFSYALATGYGFLSYRLLFVKEVDLSLFSTILLAGLLCLTILSFLLVVRLMPVIKKKLSLAG